MIPTTEKPRNLVIWGSGGHAREVAAVADACASREGWHVEGFLDDNVGRHGMVVDGYRVVGGVAWLDQHRETRIVVAVGNPRARYAIVERLRACGHDRFTTIVHPTATVSDKVQSLGAGCVLFPYAVVSSQACVGCHVMLNTFTSLSHDVVAGDFCTFAPGVLVAGGAMINQGADLGVGVRVLPQCCIGAWSTIGGGATVVHSLPDGGTYVGTPAKLLAAKTPSRVSGRR